MVERGFGRSANQQPARASSLFETSVNLRPDVDCLGGGPHGVARCGPVRHLSIIILHKWWFSSTMPKMPRNGYRSVTVKDPVVRMIEDLAHELGWSASDVVEACVTGISEMSDLLPPVRSVPKIVRMLDASRSPAATLLDWCGGIEGSAQNDRLGGQADPPRNRRKRVAGPVPQ